MKQLKLSELLLKSTRKQSFQYYYEVKNLNTDLKMDLNFLEDFPVEKYNEEIYACALGACLEVACGLPKNIMLNYTLVGERLREDVFPQLKDNLSIESIKIRFDDILSEKDYNAFFVDIPNDVDYLNLWNIIVILNDNLKLSFPEISSVLNRLGY